MKSLLFEIKKVQDKINTFDLYAYPSANNVSPSWNQVRTRRETATPVLSKVNFLHTITLCVAFSAIQLAASHSKFPTHVYIITFRGSTKNQLCNFSHHPSPCRATFSYKMQLIMEWKVITSMWCAIYGTHQNSPCVYIYLLPRAFRQRVAKYLPTSHTIAWAPTTAQHTTLCATNSLVHILYVN